VRIIIHDARTIIDSLDVQRCVAQKLKYKIIVLNYTMSDPTRPLYSVGRTLLQVAIAEPDDLLAHTPLEASHAWALSCASAASKELHFMPRGLLLYMY
jgi:hypothetical protein